MEDHPLTAFDARIDEVADLVGAALAAARDLQEAAGDVAPEQLASVTRGLGSVASHIVEARSIRKGVIVEAESGNDETEPVDEVQHDDVPEAAVTESHIDPDLKVRLGKRLMRLPSTPAQRRSLETAARKLGYVDIHTAKAALLAGRKNISAVPEMGPIRLGALAEALNTYIPEEPLPDECDPALGARICESLDEVPLSALWPTCPALELIRLYTMSKFKDITVQTMLGGSIVPPGVPYESLLEVRDSLHELRERAQAYAARFLEAQSAVKVQD